MRTQISAAAVAASLVAMAGCMATASAAVDTKRLLAASSPANAGQWMSYGRDYSEQRYSPLKQINADNVEPAGPCLVSAIWPSAAAVTRARRSSSTAASTSPAPWSKVYAFDAKTGKQLWKYDPKVPRRNCREAVLRHRQSRRRAVERQDHLGHARRAPGGGQCEDRQEGLGSAGHRSEAARCRSPARRASPTAASSSARRARSSTSAATSPPTTPTTARSCGAGGPCPAIPSKGFEQPELEMGREDLERRVVEDRRRRHAVGWHHLRPADRSRVSSAPATARRGRRRFARRAAATTCSPSSIVAVDAKTGKYKWHYQATPDGQLRLRQHRSRSSRPISSSTARRSTW